MKLGIKLEQLDQPKAFTSRRLGISFDDVECRDDQAEETVKQLFDKARKMIEEQKQEKKAVDVNDNHNKRL